MLKNNDVNSCVPEFFIICRVCLGPLIYDTGDLVTVRRMDVNGNEIAVRPRILSREVYGKNNNFVNDLGLVVRDT